MNTLYYGDNLNMLRQYFRDESVDLCYLDPPFNSARSYNMLFKEQAGEPARAQVKAFGDTWQWSEEHYHGFCTTCERPAVVELVSGLVQALGRNEITAYIVMMTPRILELHRVLRYTGSLYLHCDPTASPYLRIVCDAIFGGRNFKNEIVWQRTNVHSDSKTWSRVSDTILFYTKSDVFTWNPPYQPHSGKHVEAKYSHKDTEGRAYTLSDMTSPNPRPNLMYEWKGFPFPPNGWRYSQETMAKLDEEGRIWYPTCQDGSLDTSRRPRLKRFLDEMPGTLMGSVWTDINPINSQAAERLGYPTQKPLALLERIIRASSNPGDIVLDPFCGCGTATVAAQKLGRQWMGIDITHLAIAVIKARLADSHGLKSKKDYCVVGEPVTEEEARALALEDRDEFQKWAVGLVERARPYQDKKGADGGIDGLLYFVDTPQGDPKQVVIQVKSGHVNVSHIRDFRGVMDRTKATLGFFITLDQPTRPMRMEADSLGFYRSPLGGANLARLQTRTVGQLLEGAAFDLPASVLRLGIQKGQVVGAAQEELPY